jgi:hypothetical protein
MSISTVLGVFEKCVAKEGEASNWPIWLQRVGALLYIGYEMVGSNSLFITVMSYIYSKESLSFSSARMHLIPTGFIFWDMCWNIIPFRIEHYHYSLLLIVAYLIYQWVLVVADTILWQYSFLHADSPSCFGNYSVLLGVHAACYVVWVVLHKIRDYIAVVKPYEQYRVGSRIERTNDSINRNSMGDPERGIHTFYDRPPHDDEFFHHAPSDNEEDFVPSAPPSAPHTPIGEVHQPYAFPPPASDEDIPMAVPINIGIVYKSP